ncbi:hypothetical protein [Sphingomonas sp. S2-65]|uniref:hypothetical protein n=1 Tax=Sphingomonas sp. S2-65 TaxID=2903960 RepID=UPI001F3F6342|nr:hypothetical protein [Sphingomonas sp. S2-65]UYY57813.1 hypothetical protein LZ586_14260 [Sphingomonas sp. S2-65]
MALAAVCVGARPASAQLYGPITDPAPLVDSFGATCGAGFPDLARVAEAAKAGGFIERQTSIPSGSSLKPGTVLPRMFQKAELMLSLYRPGPAFPKAPLSCQISAQAKGKPDVRAFAALAAGRLALPAPVWTGKGDDLTAEWPSGAGQIIHLNISRYGKVRSFSMQLRTIGSLR